MKNIFKNKCVNAELFAWSIQENQKLIFIPQTHKYAYKIMPTSDFLFPYVTIFNSLKRIETYALNRTRPFALAVRPNAKFNHISFSPHTHIVYSKLSKIKHALKSPRHAIPQISKNYSIKQRSSKIAQTKIKPSKKHINYYGSVTNELINIHTIFFWPSNLCTQSGTEMRSHIRNVFSGVNETLVSENMKCELGIFGAIIMDVHKSSTSDDFPSDIVGFALDLTNLVMNEWTQFARCVFCH